MSKLYNESTDSLGPPSYPPYSSSDFVSPHRDGRGIAGGRQQQPTYPPLNNFDHEGDVDSIIKYESQQQQQYPTTTRTSQFGSVPITRGSIAAQMAAEGQIPKKEGLRMYRKDEHAGALTRGGRARCCGRVVCCTIMLVVLIIVGIVAAFFLWVKPPDVSFNGIEPPSSGQEVSIANSGFNLNFRLNIGVINPNFFGASFDRISATAYYPTKPNEAIGGGSLDDVEIPKNSNSTIHFPFSINYTTSYDSDLSVLKDMATKCGFLGSSGKSDLKVNYKVKTKVKVVAVSVSPSFSSTASFACPLSESDLQSFLGSSDLSSLGLGSLGSALGGGSRLRQRSTTQTRNTGEEVELIRREARMAIQKVLKRGWEVLEERQDDRRGIVGAVGGGGRREEEEEEEMQRKERKEKRNRVVLNSKKQSLSPPIVGIKSKVGPSSSLTQEGGEIEDVTVSTNNELVFNPNKKLRFGIYAPSPTTVKAIPNVKASSMKGNGSSSSSTNP